MFTEFLRSVIFGVTLYYILFLFIVKWSKKFF